MKLKTWSFNLTALKKDVTRFAPAWVLYSVFWLLVIIMLLDIGSGGRGFAMDMASSLQVTPVLNMMYAFLCAQLVFGDLFSSRMCNAMHAMPMRRESWFVTHVAAGVLFSLVPNLVITLFSTAFMENAWLAAPLWLLTMTLQYLFFFGVAVFSVYCTGNRFAMALVYIILNIISLIAYWLVESLYAPQLYGIVISEEPFQLLCPVANMCNERIFQVEYDKVSKAVSIVMEDGLGYQAICASVGVVFMALGLLLYRKRNLECAGDFMAVKAFSPVFLVLYCLCGGAVGYLFFDLFVGTQSLFFLLVGMLVGWFTGQMLLERSLRVFKLRKLVGCCVLILAFFASLLLTNLDPLGITRWVPQADQIKAAHVVTGGGRYDYYREGLNRYTEPGDIQTIQDIHRYGIQNRDADYNGQVDVTVTIAYELKDGRTVSRYYTVDVSSPEGQSLKKLLSRPEVILGVPASDAESFAKRVSFVRGENDKMLTGDKVVELIRVILMDCAEGNMARDWNFHRDEESSVWLSLCYKDEATGYDTYRDIMVYASCRHTMKFLEENGLLSEKYVDAYIAN